MSSSQSGLKQSTSPALLQEQGSLKRKATVLEATGNNDTSNKSTDNNNNIGHEEGNLSNPQSPIEEELPKKKLISSPTFIGPAPRAPIHHPSHFSADSPTTTHSADAFEGKEGKEDERTGTPENDHGSTRSSLDITISPEFTGGYHPSPPRNYQIQPKDTRRELRQFMGLSPYSDYEPREKIGEGTFG